MDTSGFTALVDAKIQEAQAQADIAGKLVNTQITIDDEPLNLDGKAADNQIKWQAARKAALDNLSIFLNIERDAEAWGHLINRRVQMLQNLRNVQNDATRLADATQQLHALMSGAASLVGAQQGWLGFAYIRDRIPLDIEIKAATDLPIDAAVFTSAAWKHPTHATPDMPVIDDYGTLFKWAADHSCYPKFGSPAYVALGDYLTALSSGATQEAAAIQARIEQAKKDVVTLEQIEFQRINKSTPSYDAKTDS